MDLNRTTAARVKESQQPLLSIAGREPLDRVDPDLVSQRFGSLITPAFAREHLVISQGVLESTSSRPETELIAVSGRDTDELIVHNIAVRLARPCEMVLAEPQSIAEALDRLAESLAIAGDQQDTISEPDPVDDFDAEALEALARASERDLLATTGRGPVVKLVSAILFEALRQHASDVHVQMMDDDCVIRCRIDGVLYEQRRLPSKLLGSIVSRVKVMCGLDIAERRLPQDGRAAVSIGDREIDLRVSTLPTNAGERLVVRLLDKGDASFFDLDQLGMPSETRALFGEVCTRSHGMMLVTGPTGSGKTTTLYGALLTMNSPERNIMTIEDPIEYELPGISQSQINSRKGVTFATGLRHILRQDPDVIMVGEIRDAETARTAIQSALTGHMVFSTLHTNDAPSAVTRLADLGVERYLINASLSAVLAQRLIRTLCATCRGKGCHGCRQGGLRGRTGLYEMLMIDPEIENLIAKGASSGLLKAAARERGMKTLRERGLELVEGGRTTRAEVDRVTLTDEVPAIRPDGGASSQPDEVRP